MNAMLFKTAVISAGIEITNRKQDIDALNVYPVPDGDTGSNMSMTMLAAVRALEVMPVSAGLGETAAAAADAMLKGARGNSGVILSLLFRGISTVFADMHDAQLPELTAALQSGVAATYKAVMKPAEGTILTVARIAAEKAKESEETDLTAYWSGICDAADEILEQTPEMLPVLKKAGVVDAGGKGLCIIFREMLNIFSGGECKKLTGETAPQNTFDMAVSNAHTEISFGYCTEYIVNKYDKDEDGTALRAYLESIGDCVTVAEHGDIIKIHAHTDHPGNAIEKGLIYGSLTNLKVDNMRVQHEMKVIESKQSVRPVKAIKPFGFAAVSMGHGLDAVFKDLGADVIISGGQTVNPSTEDIVNAVHSIPAETVFVLPNNKNIIMAAEQAITLSSKDICVLQSRTVPQGIAALLAFDEEADFIQNRIAMTKALKEVSTGHITFAVRDIDYDGIPIKKGEILALENNKLLFTAKEVQKAVIKLVKKLIKNDTKYVTLFYGADVTDENAESTAELLRAKLSEKIDINLVNGSQPLYYYI
ncbi:MAG: DAK2 domain-containing protein, partial [Oscillospiraceae bacterium]|nr:DAK2 domain-containing protein [Oscillospiraceae bacterium]